MSVKPPCRIEAATQRGYKGWQPQAQLGDGLFQYLAKHIHSKAVISVLGFRI